MLLALFGLPEAESELVMLILTVVTSVILAVLVNYVFSKIIRKLTAKTKTTADDAFMRDIRMPMLLLFLFLGFTFGLKQVARFEPFYGQIDMYMGAIFIFVGAKFVVEILELMFALYLDKIAPRTKSEVDEQLMPVVSNVLKIIIYLIALILVLGRFGFDIGPMLAGLGVAGIAIALAMQDTLSGFLAGFYLLADKPIRVGDFVKLASGEDGNIVEIGWRSTKIKALKNYLIVVPNKKLAETIIYNYNLPQRDMSIIMTIGVDYESDVEKVEKILKEEAKKIQKKGEGTVHKYEPTVRFENFSDYSLDFKVILRIKDYTDQWAVAAKFKKNVFMRFKKAKISIPFPTETIYLNK